MSICNFFLRQFYLDRAILRYITNLTSFLHSAPLPPSLPPIPKLPATQPLLRLVYCQSWCSPLWKVAGRADKVPRTEISGLISLQHTVPRVRPFPVLRQET